MMARQKDVILREICAEIGVPLIPLGPGSKEKKAVFEAIDRQLSLGLPADLGKPELAQAIVERGGLRWDDSCWSTGDTITAVGLERVLAACRALEGGVGDASPASALGAVGIPYQESHVRFKAEPTELLLDWEALDAATQEHADLQNSLAERLRTAGLEPMSPLPGGPRFDIAWRDYDGSLFVCEVKSSTEVNRDQQLRLGLGQVLEYRFRLQRELSEPVKAVVAITEGGPMARGVCGAAGVRLIERSRLAEDLLEIVGARRSPHAPARPAPS